MNSRVKKSRKSFEGFETSINDFRMTAKMYLYIFIVCAVLHISLMSLIAYLIPQHPEQTYYFYYKYMVAKAMSSILPDYKISVLIADEYKVMTAYKIKVWLADYAVEVNKVIIKAFVLGLPVYGLFPFMVKGFRKRAEKQAETEFIRGSQILSLPDFKRQYKTTSEDLKITENLSLPYDFETRHVLVIGTTGTGKTQYYARIIKQQLDRGAKCVIYDTKGDYTERFYSDKHYLFNPIDERGIKWTVFNDIHKKYDFDTFANSIIPEGEGESKQWNSYARDLFSTILNYCYQKNKRTNADIWDIAIKRPDEMAELFEDVKGCERGLVHLQEAKIAAGAKTVMMTYIKCFEYMSDGDFSIRDFVNSDDGKSVFVVNFAELEATLRPVLTLFIDILSKRALSLPDDRERRIYFCLDEFGSLHRLDAIKNLLTIGRSKGVSVWLAIQDLGQIVEKYNQHLTQTLLNSFSNTFIFALRDAETAKKLADRIGQKEVIEAEDHTSFGVEENKDGYSFGKKKKVENTVLAAEIMQLKDLEFFVQFTNTDWSKDKLNIIQFPANTQSFIPSNIIDIEEMIFEESEEETLGISEFKLEL